MELMNIITTLIPTTKTRFEKHSGYIMISETIWCGRVIRTASVPVKDLVQ